MAYIRQLGDATDTGSAMTDTLRAQHLHAIAVALAAAKKAGDRAKVATLLDQFQTAASAYKAAGSGMDFSSTDQLILDTERWLQQIGSAVQTGLTAAGQAVGDTAASILKPLIVPGLIALGIVYFLSRRR